MGKPKKAAPPPPKPSDDSKRNNGKAWKKRPKIFDKIKRRLVTKEK